MWTSENGFLRTIQFVLEMQNNEIWKNERGQLLLLLKEQDNISAIVFTFSCLGVECLAIEVFLSICSFVDEQEQEVKAFIIVTKCLKCTF